VEIDGKPDGRRKSDPVAPPDAPADEEDGHSHEHRKSTAALALLAIGIVFGDIGTSVLYALRECFHGPHAIAATPEHVLGVLSVIIWSLLLVISTKYLIFVLQADNRGEGGVLALVALVLPRLGKARGRKTLVLLGVFGTALLYGDGAITPAISVLSAVEGLQLAAPQMKSAILPLTIVILIGLFWLQQHGTARVGSFFAPIMVTWFAVLATTGLLSILKHPGVLAAFWPGYGVTLLAEDWRKSLFILGAAFLALTGGESLYADLGHFHRRPIRISWWSVVLPALVLNYLGQGSLLLREPEAAVNPFFFLVPKTLLLPLVGLATAAAVIASQALISGVFSITSQAVQLGYAPRMHVHHTSAGSRGQIYIPGVNWAVLAACIMLVISFGSSTRMAGAYGFAVSATMMVTTILFYFVAIEHLKWPRWKAVVVVGFMLLLDSIFFSANIVKLLVGGWVPLLMAMVLFVLMTTWKSGRALLMEQMRKGLLPIDLLRAELERGSIGRVPGNGVFLFRGTDGTPPSLLHLVKHLQVLHERTILLCVETVDVPFIRKGDRLAVNEVGAGLWKATLKYGFMERPDVPRDILNSRLFGDKKLESLRTTFFLGRETMRLGKGHMFTRMRQRIFIMMSRNAASPTEYFNLPANRVVEVGTQIILDAPSKGKKQARQPG